MLPPPSMKQPKVRIGFATAAIGGLASIGGSLISASASKKAAKKAANIADSQNRLDFYTGQQAREDTAPWRFAGNAALNQINALLGLGYIPAEAYERPSSMIRGNTDIFDQWIPKYGTTGVPGPVTTDGSGGTTTDAAGRRAAQQDAFGYFQTDPGYQFRLDEGSKALERSAAARGGALSGATMKGLERFGQNTASDEYANWLNRLFTVAGYGPVANQQSASATLAAQNLGQQAALAGGAARASGYAGAASSMNQGINNLLNIGAYGSGRGWFDNLFSGGGGLGGAGQSFGADFLGGF